MLVGNMAHLGPGSRRQLNSAPARTLLFLLLLTYVAIVAGCAASQKKPDLALLYTRSARHHDYTQNPVILIPGILGSKLVEQETGRLVWGAFTGGD